MPQESKSDPIVSIIMRSYNEGWALRETLPALKAQKFENWELIVIDSGSNDGSQELIRAAEPAHLVQITSAEYNPSKVMNHGMRLAKSEFGIFLNADATPLGSDWLRPLVTTLQDAQVAACFSRQVPRPDCEAVFACDYERCFGPARESAQWDHFFSMVSSGLRKDVWQQRGFREDLQYAEDDEYTRWCREQGYEVRYVPESVAMHSHNYTAQEARQRSFGDARAMGQSWTGRRSDFSWGRTVFLGWMNDVRKDLKFCVSQRRLSEFPHSMLVRWKQRSGKLAGFRSGWMAGQRDSS
ncbi:MAG: rhamnosyltransferase [Verrucomicrobiales bacterium]|jgi:rhamnosyltransferase